MITGVKIGGRCLGDAEPCFIIAEAGINHNGDPGQALALIDVAADSGADAVKFQTYRAENVVSRNAPKAQYQRSATDSAETQYAMLKHFELSVKDYEEIVNHCRKRSIIFLSTAHDCESIGILEALGVPAFKVGSGDLTNFPYLKRVAEPKKPILLSTGMATLGEVEDAVELILSTGNRELLLLHCVSNYPAAAEESNLRALQTLRLSFQVPVGFSDHTLGFEVSLAAVAMGACVIEKHLTLDQSLPGPDHRSSLCADEFLKMVEGIRKVEQALGNGLKRPTEAEKEMRMVARKSLVAKVQIPAGTRITREMLAVKRPEKGISPRFMDQVIGRTARKTISPDVSIAWRDLC